MPNKILIVDDEPIVLKLMCHFLRKAGFKVLVAENGETAIKQVIHLKPDLIILDVIMPGIDGFETCRLLKMNKVTEDTPIIFLSIDNKPVDKVKGFEVGAVDYITKPFQTTELIARINKHLTICNLQKQLEAKNAQLQDYIYHLESLSTLEKVINETQNITQMMDNAIKTTLSVFNCDRAWLLYPCDPAAPSWQIPTEITRPEYPGVNILNTDIMATPDLSEIIKNALSTTEPITLGYNYEHKIDPMMVKQFSIQSQLCLAIHPKIGKPWMFGLHQCSYARIWTENEINLFRDFGHHISENLGLFLSFEERQKSEEQFRGYFESALLGFAITSLEKGWIYANKCICDMLGYSLEELKKLTWDELTYIDDLVTDAAQFERLLAGDIDGYTMDKRFVHKNSSIVYGFMSVTARHQKDGSLEHIVVTLQDITERKQAEMLIQYQANYDVLTDLPNRQLFMDRLKQALRFAQRQKIQLALMFIDLDKFKEVNDSFGHSVGDELLQIVSKRLTACVRKSDTVARLGGDEFTVILPKISHYKDIEIIAKKILIALSQPFPLRGQDVEISASIGIAFFPDEKNTEVDSETLLKNADAAMYNVKKEGRNAFQVFSVLGSLNRDLTI